MRWYLRVKQAGTKPPAYLLERISDIRHAATLLRTEPGEARKILAEVASALESHGDKEHAAATLAVATASRDSPPKAREMALAIIKEMMIEKEEYNG